jgi:site-specific recombinase XerC
LLANKGATALKAMTKWLTLEEVTQYLNMDMSSACKLVREAGRDIRRVQELLGHKDVKTMMIYTHVLNRGGKGIKIPADDL